MARNGGGVSFAGQPLTLVGQLPRLRQDAPDARLTGEDLDTVRLKDYWGQPTILTAVPSLDTSVCATEAKRFDQEAVNLDPGVQILLISMDLPFAQARWRQQAGVTRVQMLSDYRNASFGRAYGVLIKELRLLARSVFLVDAKGKLRYRQLVPDIASEPNYGEVLEALKHL